MLGGIKSDIKNAIKTIPYALILLPLYILIVPILYIFSLFNRKHYRPAPANTDSVIIITGCDSGIGKSSAIKLVGLGYHVIASVFTESGGNQLKEEVNGFSGELSFYLLDITKDQSVSQFKEFVDDILEENKSKRLVGLVNNAGVVLPAVLELQPFSQFARQIDVNLFGHIKVTQQFLAMIRKSKGRVVNICSVAGRISAAHMGAYNASKHAMEAITDTLRLEMDRFNVSVSAIEPGFTKTEMLKSVSGGKQYQIWDNLLDAGKEDYEIERRKFLNSTDRLNTLASSVSYVGDSVVHALTSPYPKTRYLVGIDANFFAFLRWALPDRLLDTLLQWTLAFQ